MYACTAGPPTRASHCIIACTLYHTISWRDIDLQLYLYSLQYNDLLNYSCVQTKVMCPLDHDKYYVYECVTGHLLVITFAIYMRCRLTKPVTCRAVRYRLRAVRSWKWSFYLVYIFLLFELLYVNFQKFQFMCPDFNKH